MSLELFIARRYLFAKKSHNVINLISLVSAVGVAIGTFALVVALSVYNGIEGLIVSLYDTLAPDLKITAVEGKVFDPQQPAFDAVKQLQGVAYYSEALEEHALLKYRNRQHLGVVRGVDDVFLSRSGLAGSIVEGEPDIRHGDVNTAIVGKEIAALLELRPAFFDLLWIYFPKRGMKLQSLNALNPEAMLNREYLKPAGIFSVELEADSRYVFVPLDMVQHLLGYTHEVSSVELYLLPDAHPKAVKSEVQRVLGDRLKVQTREEQNELLYRMTQGEKWAIFFILAFVLLVASFNSIGSLTMLIIEKKKDVRILQSLGAQAGLVRRVFVLEGTMLTLLGCAAGLTLGVAACYAQIWFGLIPMPGNYVVPTYPVAVNPLDLVLVAGTVMLIGVAAAGIPVRFLLGKRL